MVETTKSEASSMEMETARQINVMRYEDMGD